MSKPKTKTKTKSRDTSLRAALMKLCGQQVGPEGGFCALLTFPNGRTAYISGNPYAMTQFDDRAFRFRTKAQIYQIVAKHFPNASQVECVSLLAEER